jgi:NAD(P)-dependent dehydrogenase (short-subunit alcohol dehydrogenase family)
MKTYLVTGATGGLGFNISNFLSQMPENRVILAVRDTDRGNVVSNRMGKNVEAVNLNLSSLKSIDAFTSSWKGELTGLVNNAGCQIVNETRFTKEEHFEETFAVNHLAALKLTMDLLPFIHGGRVLFIGSGTHNPNYRAATIFGFRGARYKSIKKCAEGLDEEGPIKQIGFDRYATSKFLTTVTTIELARRIVPEKALFFCLDPGLMPGTGLARTAAAPMQFIWKNILPILGKFLPGTSTARRSAQTAVWIMSSKEVRMKSGTIFSYNRKPSKAVWSKAFDKKIGREVIDDSLKLL